MTTIQNNEEPVVVKKRVNSKAKGNSFELTVSKLLSSALNPLSFTRSPGSGARVGGKNFQTFGKMFGEDSLKIFVGDIVCLNERDTGLNFKFSIETKFYKTPDSFTSLFNNKANIFKWFEESCVDAIKINKEPMLIFKWNNTPIFVAVENNYSLTPNLIIENNRKLSIFVLADLLKVNDFWITS